MLARIRKSMEEKDEGFTLIELLVVIIIIGILAAIAIPVFLNQRKKGYDSQAKSDLRNMATAEETYLTDYNYYGLSVANLTSLEGFKQSANVTTETVEGLDGAGAKTTAPTASGYCETATSQSGNSFYWNSETGGLTATACP